LVIGYWLLVIGYWLLVIGYWLLVIGYWLLVIGYWLLVIGYWLLVICFSGEFWNDGSSRMFDERLMSNESLVQNYDFEFYHQFHLTLFFSCLLNFGQVCLLRIFAMVVIALTTIAFRVISITRKDDAAAKKKRVHFASTIS
jgi:hypothetical protein